MAAIAALALIFVALAALAAWNFHEKGSYSRQISLAKSYYEKGDYSEAVLTYQRAIQLEPEREEGYAGLIKVYTVQGNTVMANSVLRRGAAVTGSNRLEIMLEKYEIEAEGAKNGDPWEMGGEKAKIDTALLRFFRTSTYNDYRIRNGIQSSVRNSDGTFTIRAADVSAELVFLEKDIDPSNEKPRSQSLPHWVILDDASELFYGRAGITTDYLGMLGAGHIQVLSDKVYHYIVSFSLEGCEISIASDKDGLISEGAWCRIQLPEAAEEEPVESEASEPEAAETFRVSGYVLGAVTGSGVPAAQVVFRPEGERDGQGLLSTYTDEDGRYEASLESGRYTAEISAEGYKTEYFQVVVQGEDVDEAFVISPVLQEGQIRIVLEWGEQPSDLDSYLEGTLDSGKHVYTYFASQSCRSGGETLAELDVDDRDGFGPETTTIYDINGTFEFYVKDFTNSGTMSSSGATVKIYTPDTSDPVVVEICGGLENMWSVCTIDHGEVTVTNHA